MTSFAELGLAAPILKALETEGYTTPTPIQSQAIPHVLAGRDVQGIAQTGTGKTAAFALPILHRLLADRRPPLRRGCRVLVLSPTRELASRMLRGPGHVAVTPVATTAERVDQKVIFVEAARKRQMLANILRDKRMERTLVFTRTKHGADKVTHHLEAAGQPAAAIHGN